METQNEKDKLNQLPARAAEYIKQVMHKMRYRRKIRKDVQAELEAHFEDYLKDCKNDAEKGQKAEQLIADFGNVKLPAVLLRRAKKRCRPLREKVILRTAHVIGIIFLYLIICIIPMTIGKPTIKIDYVQWLNERNKAGRDESDNARNYYEKAAELSSQMPNWLAESAVQWPTDFDDSERKSLAEWLNSNKEAYETFRKAVKLPSFWNYYEVSDNEYKELSASRVITQRLMDLLSNYKQLASAIKWQISYEAYTGDVNQAFEDCLSLVKFGHNLQRSGFIIEELVGIAVEAIAIHESSRIISKMNVSSKVLTNMQESLENLYEKDKPVISLDSEKIFWYDMVQRSFTDDGKGDGRVLRRGLSYAIGSNLDWLRKALLFDYPTRKETLATIDQVFAKSQELMKKTLWQLHNEGLDANNWANDIPNKSLMLQLEGQSLYQLCKPGWILETERRVLLAELALMRYKNEKGQYPDELSQLVSFGYLKKLPNDPYSNKPLVYKKNGSDFILYSVGSNLIDDNGNMGINSQGKKRNYLDNGDWVFWPVQ
jgi:hypothetical protein